MNPESGPPEPTDVPVGVHLDGSPAYHRIHTPGAPVDLLAFNAAAVRGHLAELNGTARSAVALLAGVPAGDLHLYET